MGTHPCFFAKRTNQNHRAWISDAPRISWQETAETLPGYEVSIKVKVDEPGAEREVFLQLSTAAIHTLKKIGELSKSLRQYTSFHDVSKCFVTLVKATQGGGAVRKVIGLVVPSLEHPLNTLIGTIIQVTDDHSFLLEHLLPEVNKIGWGVPLPRPVRETQLEHWKKATLKRIRELFFDQSLSRHI